MEKWVANCKRDYEMGEEFTKLVLSDKTRLAEKVSLLKGRFVGKIVKGIDNRTRVDSKIF